MMDLVAGQRSACRKAMVASLFNVTVQFVVALANKLDTLPAASVNPYTTGTANVYTLLTPLWLAGRMLPNRATTEFELLLV